MERLPRWAAPDWDLLDANLTVLGKGEGLLVDGVNFPVIRAGQAHYVQNSMRTERYEVPHRPVHLAPGDTFTFTYTLELT